MTQTAAIVTTLKNPGPSLESFLSYHTSIGFSHIFLFFDDPRDPALRSARKHPNVTIIKKDARLYRLWERTEVAMLRGVHNFIDSEVMARQELNVEIAIQLAAEKSIDWLLHIDSDELFYHPAEGVREHFQALTEKEIDSVIYPNYEAIPETVEIKDCFKEATLFKKNFFMGRKRGLSRSQKIHIKSVPQLPEHFFLFYANGKAAARVRKGLLPLGVHRFVNSNGDAGDKNSCVSKFKTVISKDAVVLHYPCCGFNNFWNKYLNLGAFDNKWFNTAEIETLIGSFHLESRDVVMRNDKKVAREFYKNRAVISEKAIINGLLRNGLVCRIGKPADLLKVINRK